MKQLTITAVAIAILCMLVSIYHNAHADAIPSPIPMPSPTSITYNFNSYWVKSVVIQAPSPSKDAYATIVLAPVDLSQGALSDKVVTIATRHVFADISAGDSLAASAMQAILAYAQSHLPVQPSPSPSPSAGP